MSEILIRHVQGDHFLVDVGGHTLSVDQPEASGGEDRGPTPTELFVAGLAACVAF
jgi:putative redox protein